MGTPEGFPQAPVVAKRGAVAHPLACIGGTPRTQAASLPLRMGVLDGAAVERTLQARRTEPPDLRRFEAESLPPVVPRRLEGESVPVVAIDSDTSSGQTVTWKEELKADQPLSLGRLSPVFFKFLYYI